MLSAAALEAVLARIGIGGPAREFESQHLDFKRPAETIKSTLAGLADAAVCFANAEGGTLVLGIDDKASSRAGALVGSEPGYTVDLVRKGIYDRTAPPMTVSAREHLEEGVRLVIIDVPQGIATYSNASGLATRRMGTECLPFTPQQQREVLIARGEIDWSAEPSDVLLQDLDSAEIQRARGRLRELGKDELSELRDKPLLEALRLVTDDGEATNAAVILFGGEDQLRSVIPDYGYSYQYRPTAGTEATYRFRGQASFLRAVDGLLNAVERRIEIRPLNVAGGVQLQLTDYPAAAVREVVVNALLHRAYDLPGSVDIEHSSERLVVTSPGPLVAGVTPENILTHPSTPRNRLLSEAVAVLQLAEKTGQGIDRAYRDMLRAGKNPPTIEDDGLSVRATLVGGIGNDAFVRFIQELPDELSRDVEVLITLSLLRTATSITASDLAVAIQRSPIEAQDVLARLADPTYSLLEPTARTIRKPFPAYRLRNEPLAALARAVSYRRRTLDQRDEKVVEHVQEYGFVTNRTLQRLFDLNVYGARNMLTDLRDRGIVEKLGTARGGPGVRYGPGPKFPKKDRRN
jgi:ATP-dependent DNA helicase RecG